MYECAIIGTGAAGISAALTLKALNKNFIWFGDGKLSGKIRSAEKIGNYPGLSMVSGNELAESFLSQIKEMDIRIENKTVTGVYQMEGYFSVLCNQDMYDAKTVILATGVESVKPVKGELEFVGRGVSYCATCDGFLYKGKTVFVVCTEKSLEHEIEYLASLAAKVYVVALYKNVALKSGNIEIVSGMPVEITGGRKAEKVRFRDKEYSVDGVFMLKAAITPSVLVSGLETENGHVKVDRSCATNLEGCFAAGDCTGRPYQYAKAVGEGNVCAHAVVSYLAEQKQKETLSTV
ncbi:MAG: NAD(P)/FAD-dependent oxidoreductase [Clostridia bacterium]|nr:NAD(P)/FAD-dependent oxidoreductase [Clostridia bacterium]